MTEPIEPPSGWPAPPPTGCQMCDMHMYRVEPRPPDDLLFTAGAAFVSFMQESNLRLHFEQVYEIGADLAAHADVSHRGGEEEERAWTQAAMAWMTHQLRQDRMALALLHVDSMDQDPNVFQRRVQRFLTASEELAMTRWHIASAVPTASSRAGRKALKRMRRRERELQSLIESMDVGFRRTFEGRL